MKTFFEGSKHSVQNICLYSSFLENACKSVKFTANLMSKLMRVLRYIRFPYHLHRSPLPPPLQAWPRDNSPPDLRQGQGAFASFGHWAVRNFSPFDGRPGTAAFGRAVGAHSQNPSCSNNVQTFVELDLHLRWYAVWSVVMRTILSHATAMPDYSSTFNLVILFSYVSLQFISMTPSNTSSVGNVLKCEDV